MSSNRCARCEQIVYPVEGLRCLDKLWHKGCFKCHECNMTLSLKNHRGFDKKPYCNAHCPQAKATTVVDTPETRRLAENTRIQSQAKYHEDFEKSKGKGFTAIADDPETIRLKNTSKIISNVAYHGEKERKKQMEEKRGQQCPEEMNQMIISNNNNAKHQNRMLESDPMQNQVNIQLMQNQSQQIQNQQKLQQVPRQQQQQMHYTQDNVVQQQANRRISAPIIHQPPNHPQQVIANNNQAQHNQQLILQQRYQMMQQQQQQQRLIQQQQRHSIDSINSRQPRLMNNYQQQSIDDQMIPVQQLQQQHQQQLKYLPLNNAYGIQQPANHIIGSSVQMLNYAQTGAQRAMFNPTAAAGQAAHHIIRGHNHQQQHIPGHMMSGVSPKHQEQQLVDPAQARNMIRPSQSQINYQPQMQPAIQQQIRHPQQTMPKRVFRAMYDYAANDVDEVSFFENDILVDCVDVDGNWMIGKVARSGQTGMLPANYVTEFNT